MPTPLPYESDYGEDPFDLNQPAVKRSSPAPTDSMVARGLTMPKDWRQAPYQTATVPAAKPRANLAPRNDRDVAKLSRLGDVPMMTGAPGEKNVGLEITRPAKKAMAAPGAFEEADPTVSVSASRAGLTDRSNLTEGERQKLLSDIQYQQNALGPLNMASKRRLAGDLLELRRQVTGDRMGQLGAADAQANGMASENARREQDAGLANAGFSDKAIDRRSAARAAAAQRAFENDPNSLSNRLRIAANERAERADRRAGEKQDNEFKAQRDKYEGDIVETRAKAIADEQGISLDQARGLAQRGLADENLSTKQPNLTTTSALGELGIRRDLANKLNEGTSFGQYLGEAFSNSGRAFHFSDPRVDPESIDPSKVETGERGGLVKVINAAFPGQPLDPYYAQLPGQNGQEGPRTPLTQEEYDAFIRRKKQFTRE